MGIIGMGYASLSWIIVLSIIPPVFLFTGLGRRIAGGIVGDWTQGEKIAPGFLAKCFFAFTVGLSAFLGMIVSAWINDLSNSEAVPFIPLWGMNPTLFWWLVPVVNSIAIAIGTFVGHVVFGLWNSAGMGRYGDKNELFTYFGNGKWLSLVDQKIHSKPGFFLSCLGMFAYGLQLVVIAIAVTFCPYTRGIWEIVLIGALLVPIDYAVSWVIWWKEKHWITGVNQNPLQQAEWGIGIIGVATYLGFALYNLV